MSNDPSLSVSAQPGIQAMGGSREPSQVGNHPIEVHDNENSPSSEATVSRTGHTSLLSRMVVAVKQFFTHRAVPPAPAPVPAPAAPVQGTNPAPPPSPPAPSPNPEAAGAGYRSAAVIVGETPLRVYARNERTLHEIQGILGQPGLLSGEEMIGQFEILNKNLAALGFPENTIRKITGTLCTAGGNISGYVEGNETKRQRDLRGSKKDEVGPFQSCQPPDKARIAGAKALSRLNSWFQTLTTCAAKCPPPLTDRQIVAGKKFPTNDRAQVAGRKQLLEELESFCSEPEFRIVTLEWNIGGNNACPGDRVYNPMISGPATALDAILRDPENSSFSSLWFQNLAKNYGRETFERVIQTFYQISWGDRKELKAAYEGYCKQTGGKPIDLDRLVFTPELRAMREIRQKTIEFIRTNVPGEKQEAAIAQFEEQIEQNFQTWLKANKKEEADGSVTIDVGHIKIMVNEEQLKKVTLQSLTNL